MNPYKIKVVYSDGATLEVTGRYSFTMNRNRATITDATIEGVTEANVPRPYNFDLLISYVKNELKTSVEAAY